MDIDLGPVFLYIFVALIVIPALIGLLVGIGTSYLLIRKMSVSKTKKVATIFLVGILLAFLFPAAKLKFIRLQTDYEDEKFSTNEKQYIKQNLSSFRIEKVSFSQNSYQIVLSVPRVGKYRVMVYLFQNGEKTILLSKWKDGIDFVEGVNTLDINIQNINIFTIVPADLVVAIQNDDEFYALRNTRKSLVVTNGGAIVKQEGIIYYSPSIVTDKGECPVFNYLNWLPCVPNNLLRME